MSDPCLFWKKSRTGKLILLFLFVDDMQIAFDESDDDEYAEILDMLTKRFNISNLGDSKYMLGMRITRDLKAKTIFLDQELYITKALEKFGLAQCRSEPTPAVQSSSAPKTAEEMTADDEHPADVHLYQEKVGTLLYAAISTRPDISFAVNKLTQKMSAPRIVDMKSCDRVFRYLAGSKNKGLTFGGRSESKLTAWADADWGTDWTDRRSQTGWLAMLWGDLVSWASQKQKVVAQSTCEAELYAEAAAINEMSWIRGLLSEISLFTDQDATPILYGDNQSAQKLTETGIKSERTKHIAIKYAFIHDEVEKGRVKLQWVPTTEQLADVLTKALPRPQHEILCKQLMTKRE